MKDSWVKLVNPVIVPLSFLSPSRDAQIDVDHEAGILVLPGSQTKYGLILLAWSCRAKAGLLRARHRTVLHIGGRNG